jgi:hypothetical protein
VYQDYLNLIIFFLYKIKTVPAASNTRMHTTRMIIPALDFEFLSLLLELLAAFADALADAIASELASELICSSDECPLVKVDPPFELVPTPVELEVVLVFEPVLLDLTPALLLVLLLDFGVDATESMEHYLFDDRHIF